MLLKRSQVLQENTCIGVSLIKLQTFAPDLCACNFKKKRHQHRCLSVKFAKSLGNPVLKDIYERLLLWLQQHLLIFLQKDYIIDV